MFIHVSRDLKVTLEDAQDFKRFKLVIDAARDDGKLKTALAPVATLSEDGHAWVKEAWLREQDRSVPWQDGLTAMIGVAKKYGWVDEQAKTIRAHIEWPSEATTKS
jgi:hypothetical protein